MVLTKPQVRARLGELETEIDALLAAIIGRWDSRHESGQMDLLFDEMPLLAAAVAKQKEAIGLMRLVV